MMKWRDCWKNIKKWKNPGLDVIQTFVSLTLVGRFYSLDNEETSSRFFVPVKEFDHN